MIASLIFNSRCSAPGFSQGDFILKIIAEDEKKYMIKIHLSGSAGFQEDAVLSPSDFYLRAMSVSRNSGLEASSIVIDCKFRRVYPACLVRT